MQENKSPGKGRIPREFYLAFWPIMKNDFTEMINYTFFIKTVLPESMKTVIISVIPKDQDYTDIARWRPISHLCVDY